MINDNCSNCLYSYSMTSFETMKIIGHNMIKCDNENSPYYDSFINDNTSCRLFIDANQKFKMDDRRESILKIKENIKFGK